MIGFTPSEAASVQDTFLSFLFSVASVFIKVVSLYNQEQVFPVFCSVSSFWWDYQSVRSTRKCKGRFVDGQNVPARCVE